MSNPSRPIDTGRRDALGRPVKVSTGDSAQRATAPAPLEDSSGDRVAEIVDLLTAGGTQGLRPIEPVTDPELVDRHNDYKPVINAVNPDDPDAVAGHVADMFGRDWWAEKHRLTGDLPALQAWHNSHPCPERLWFAQDCGNRAAAIAAVQSVGGYNDYDDGRVADSLNLLFDQHPDISVTFIRQLTPNIAIRFPAGTDPNKIADNVSSFKVNSDARHMEPVGHDDGSITARVYWW